MINEKIEYLTWDSDFFKKKIGRVLAENSEEIINVFEEAKKDNYQLIYVFGNENLFVDEKILKQFNGHLADRKVLFKKNIESKKEQTSFVSEYTGNELTTELEQLAYESGKYSRFKTDKNFAENDFYRMYKIWILKSLTKEMADNVFVVKEDDVVKGMITLKIDGTKGHIGLFAISPDMQGKGYGKALVHACENELLNKNRNELEVPTQIKNRQACKFYEKYGFQIKTINNIYHFWL